MRKIIKGIKEFFKESFQSDNTRDKTCENPKCCDYTMFKFESEVFCCRCGKPTSFRDEHKCPKCKEQISYYVDFCKNCGQQQVKLKIKR